MKKIYISINDFNLSVQNLNNSDYLLERERERERLTANFTRDSLIKNN